MNEPLGIYISKFILSGDVIGGIRYLVSLKNENYEIYALKAYLYAVNGDYDTAFEILNNIITSCENDIQIIVLKIVKSDLFWRIGQLNRASNLIDLNWVKNLEEAGLFFWVSYLYNILGNISLDNAKYDFAMKYYNLALEYAEQINDLLRIIKCLNNIGEIYKEQGNMDMALQYYTHAFISAETYQKTPIIGVILNNMGDVNRIMGRINLALRCYKRSLKIKQKYDNKVTLAETYMRIIMLFIQADQIDDAKEYLKSLEELEKNSELKEIQIRYKLAKALILKKSRRAIDIANAQSIFYEISSYSDIRVEFTILSLINISEILMLELKIYQDDRTIKELNDIISKLQYIAEKNSLAYLLVETLSLKAKLFFLNGNLDDTYKTLDYALAYSKNKNLNMLIDKIKSQYSEFSNELKQWFTVIDNKSNLRQRIEQVRIEEYLHDLSQNHNIFDIYTKQIK